MNPSNDDPSGPAAGNDDSLVNRVHSDVRRAQGRRPTLPDRVGQYRIIDLLGQGGMGVVYLAQQEHPDRLVALKVTRSEFHTPTHLRRFEHEVRVLARLEHPLIARIYEAGIATVDSNPRPFFAMEHVVGRSLTDYVREVAPPTALRLELLALLCDAVHYAHQRGVIHRDLKPANILVDDSGRPRILDFGVARSIDSDVQATRHTAVDQLVGSIPYMSPEQVAGDPALVDVRSDVYALGLVGYAILTGSAPYDLAHQPVPEMLRIIREVDARPIGTFDRSLKGDVECIFSTAVMKDPNRRYQSASDFAADIRRHLRCEPIAARPPSTLYRVHRFVRRNRALAIGSGLAVIGLIATAAGTSLGLVQANAERDRAQKVTEFFGSILSTAHFMEQGKDVPLRAVLDHAAERVGTEFSDDALTEARIRSVLGLSYSGLSQTAAAETNLRIALDINREQLGPRHMFVYANLYNLGEVYAAQSRFREAEETHLEAVSICNEQLGADDDTCVGATLALVNDYRNLGDYDQAIAIHTRVLSIRRRTLQPTDPKLARTIRSGALLLSDAGRYGEALTRYEEAHDIMRSALGPGHMETLNCKLGLAVMNLKLGRYDEAEPELKESIALHTQAFGPDHPGTQVSTSFLANLYRDRGDYDQSEPLMREVLAARQRTLGPQHSQTISSLSNLAHLLKLRGRFEEAETLYRDAVALRIETVGAEHRLTLLGRMSLGAVCLDLGKLDEAEALIDETVQVSRRTLGDDHDTTVSAVNLMAATYHRQDRFDDAEPLFRAAVEARTAVLGAAHPNVLASTYGLARMLIDADRLDEAETLLNELVPLARDALPAHHDALGRYVGSLGVVLAQRGRLQEGEALLAEGHDILDTQLGADHPHTIELAEQLADVRTMVSAAEDDP